MLGEGEADAVLPAVKDAVVLSQEDVPQDPKVTCGRDDVGTLEASEAELLIPQHLLGINTRAEPVNTPSCPEVLARHSLTQRGSRDPPS